MGKFCKLCLSMTSEDFYEINKSKYRKQLETVIPELNINSIQAPLLCQKCSKVIEAAYELKIHSLRVDKYISVFVEIMQTDLVPASEIFNIKTELGGEFNAAATDNISFADIQKTEDNDIFSDECIDLTESLPDSAKVENSNDLVKTLAEDDYKENCLIELNPQSVPQYHVNKKDGINTHNLCKYEKCHKNIKFEIKCNVCGEKFNSDRELRGHNYHYHVKIRKPDFVSSTDGGLHLHSITKPFSCKTCLRTFTGKISLLEFMCSACEKTARIKSGLGLYYKRHRGGSLQPCKICNKRYDDISDLRKHVLRHGDEKPHRPVLLKEDNQSKCSSKRKKNRSKR